jgi:hypothetical protein
MISQIVAPAIAAARAPTIPTRLRLSRGKVIGMGPVYNGNV